MQLKHASVCTFSGRWLFRLSLPTRSFHFTSLRDVGSWFCKMTFFHSCTPVMHFICLCKYSNIVIIELNDIPIKQASEDHLKKHYADLADKPFYPGLCKYMSSGPLVAMCWEGTGVVKTARVMMGETRPADSKPGTIRGDFCIEVGRNIIHGSDSIESANKEIALWFKPEELFSWTQANETWIYE